MNYNIGLDISGGDYAPAEIFKGAILAKKEFGQNITLIGLKSQIEEQARIHRADLGDFTVVDAPETIEMADSPATAVRKKKRSSIAIGATLLKEKKIDAFVSCGNTGAAVCAATLILGLIEGVERPGIAIVAPTQKGVALILDVGANIDPKPLHLLQYGVMAKIYSEVVLHKKNPTIGLLNIGEEETKGPDFLRGVHKLFSASSLNFTGNIEGKDIFKGNCDCIICDGFIGNITLKVIEGCAEVMGKLLLSSLQSNFIGRVGLFLAQNNLRAFKKKMSYSEYGGAPLLGVDGIVIIGHGRSDAFAVKNAVRVAIEELEHDINSKIKGQVNEICQDNRVREVLTA